MPKKPAMWKNLKSEDILQKVQKDMKWGESENSDKPQEMVELPVVKKTSIFDKIVPKIKPSQVVVKED